MDSNNENEQSLSRTDVDIMDVSPDALPDTIITDENKENDDAQLEQTPLLTSVTRHPQHPLTDGIAPPLAQTATANPSQSTGLSPTDEDNRDTQFTYVLRKYDSITDSRVYSPWHIFGGYKWRLLIFPKGNHTSNHDLSVYLECGGPYTRDSHSQHNSAARPMSPNGKETAVSTLPPTGWNRPAKFSLHLVNPSSAIAKAAVNSDNALTDPSLIDLEVSDSSTSPRSHLNSRGDLVKETSHIFRPNVSDWGFLEFASFTSLQPNGYADNEMNVVIMVKIRLLDQAIDPSFTNTTPWDSRKETGLVGFKNQGATCYMNSLLQTLYMLSAFRKAVYNMPLPEPGDTTGSELSYALQKVFYELQFSPSVVKTKKLTESFGWDTTDAFTQHDVQELKLILCDELAEKMKRINPDEPNTLSTLFQGEILNYIECVNVPYKSTREEEFSDLSLNVKGCQNIYESFEKYTEVEMMDGDNKYRADGFEELQDARKGVKFLKLPPVLQLHLKRFEYDTTRDAMVKINDRYEFETEIDLSRFVENSDGSDMYVLHSVLVHIGDVNGGHYHAFIRPEIDVSDNDPKKPSQWYKFDDETVVRATEEAAVQDNFGVGGEKEFAKRGLDDDMGNGGLNGQTNPPSVFHNRGRNYQPKRFSNAYMLQYLRKSDVPYLLSQPKEGDVPEVLALRIQKEREEEEKRKRQNTEQHLYMTIAVATDADMVQHHFSDLVNWEKVRPIQLKRATQLGELKSMLQNDGLVHDARRMRLWKCVGRQNQTLRPDALVANGEDSQPIDTHTHVRDGLGGGFNVPIHTGRHGYHGHDDILRLYAEDFCSRYCLSAGAKYNTFKLENERKLENNLVKSSAEENSYPEKLLSDVPRVDYSAWSFPLKAGRETLLFLKYYVSQPSPRLQWLGHLVIDRNTTVKDLEPLLLKAVNEFHQADDTIAELDSTSVLRVFEEVCATTVKELDGNKTLEHYQIPCDSCGNGDIIVFQEFSPSDENEFDFQVDNDGIPIFPNEIWDGFQEISRGDGTDMPLGGRPLPCVTMFYEYLAYRVKIEFKDRQQAGDLDDGLSIFFELSRKDSYRTARKVLSGALIDDVDPDYIRFFSHDFNRNAPAPEAFRISDDDPLDRLMPLHTMVATNQPEYRTIWYERTEYHISEFEHKEEVRVIWRPDCGTRSTGYLSKSSVAGSGNGVVFKGVDTNEVSDVTGRTDMSVDGDEKDSNAENGEVNGDDSQSSAVEKNVKTFSVLVPISSKFADVIEQVRTKMRVGPETEIRMFEVKNSRIVRFIDADDPVPTLVTGCHDYGIELRAEPTPPDEVEEVIGDEYQLMAVVHLAKQGRTWRGLSFFGQPFVIKVKREGEDVEVIRRRIQTKIGVPSEEFDSWAMAEISQLKAVYIEEGTIYKPRSPMAMEFCSLAIEHKSTAPPKRQSSTVRPIVDKPLKIRS